MSKRYWFYVVGHGSFEGIGEHRVCFSTSDVGSKPSRIAAIGIQRQDTGIKNLHCAGLAGKRYALSTGACSPGRSS